MIKRIVKYIQEVQEAEGVEVKQIIAEEPVDCDEPIIFSGQAVIGLRTNEGVMQQPITFKIPGVRTIEEAFEKFNEAREEEAPKEAQKVVEAIQAKMREAHEQQRNQIVLPNGANIPNV